MNGPIAQPAALVCHVNAVLRGMAVPPFWPDHSTVQFSEETTFAVSKSGAWVCVARNPDEWFDYIRRHGAVRVALSHAAGEDRRQAEWQTAGLVGGGGLWTMDWYAPDGYVRAWRGRLTKGDARAGNKRIWRDWYGVWQIVERRPPPVPTEADLAVCEQALRAALHAIGAFAAQSPYDAFRPAFLRAVEALDGKVRGYHRHIAPGGVLGARATALLDACQVAWVFGAMGSWNDLPQGETYARLSAALYDAIVASVCGAVNGSAAGLGA